MDDKKRYEGALGRAKEILCDGNCQDIEYIFPELRDDEDERTRKWLVAYIEAHVWRKDFAVTKEQVLAWLDAQKEEDGVEFIPIENTLEYKAGFSAGVSSRARDWTEEEKNRIDRINAYFTSYRAILKSPEANEIMRNTLPLLEEDWDWLEEVMKRKPADYDHEMWKNCEANFEGGKNEVINNPEKYGLQKSTGLTREMKETLLRMMEDAKKISKTGSTSEDNEYNRGIDRIMENVSHM